MFTRLQRKDKNRKQTLNIQFFPSYERRQLSSNYEREQLETSTKRVETKTQNAKGNVNREQHRSSDKSHGTMGRQRSKPGTRAEENRPTPIIELHRTKEDTIKEFI